MTPADKLAAVVAEIAQIGETQSGTVMCQSVIRRLQLILAELQRAQGRLTEEVRKLHVYTRSEIDRMDYNDGVGFLSQDHVYYLLSAPTPANSGNEWDKLP